MPGMWESVQPSSALIWYQKAHPRERPYKCVECRKVIALTLLSMGKFMLEKAFSVAGMAKSLMKAPSSVDIRESTPEKSLVISANLITLQL